MERMNKPFVALLVAIVGLVVGGFVAATAGPPLKEVTTYQVEGSAPILPLGEVNHTTGQWYTPTTVSVACKAGDLVVSGGYDTTFHGSQFYDTKGIHIVASYPFAEVGGTQGWNVTAGNDLGYPGDSAFPIDPNLVPHLVVRATCLHRA